MNNINTFQKMKQDNEKIVMLTAYDYPSGKMAQDSQVDLILVGDSLGMVVLGYDNTINVVMEDMIHHAKATRRGAKDTFVIVDMPFRSYHISKEETKRNAFRLMIEGNANAVKLEGGTKSRVEMISAIVDCEIPVVAHLGLTPQSVHTMGGFVVQGKKPEQFDKILEQALAIEKAGAFMLVLEGIPEKLGKEISENIKIPTIGIGAGRYTDGQVLVYHDVLGFYDFKPKFVKKYMDSKEIIVQAISEFKKDVKNGNFPAKQNVYLPLKT
ncbi:MAG: 3-methyl-2-oxobutanoate hydroxymethyltransferase [Candidatus Cloacimonetes bacterium]|nr:3-methyl-2-oxobutanoate hydroxymethyltransferase [Candidatus Cloacimonadota bacterium]